MLDEWWPNGYGDVFWWLEVVELTIGGRIDNKKAKESLLV